MVNCHPMKIELVVEVITYWPLYALCLRQRVEQSTNKQNRKSRITLLKFETYYVKSLPYTA